MKIEDAIRMAIEYENKIQDVYAQAADDVSDERGKKVLRMLAEEERGHLSYLQSKLSEWQDNGVLTFDGIPSSLPSLDAIRTAAKGVANDFAGKSLKRERQILEQAIKAEIDTSRFYEELVSKLTDEGQAMFTRFVEIENDHLQLVQAELDYITGSGFWFDFAEIDMEAV